jgi:hypothetical protein
MNKHSQAVLMACGAARLLHEIELPEVIANTELLLKHLPKEWEERRETLEQDLVILKAAVALWELERNVNTSLAMTSRRLILRD